MKYIKAKDAKPREDVFVYIVTKLGKRGVAMYWPKIDQWLTKDYSIRPDDAVVKWRYNDAT